MKSGKKAATPFWQILLVALIVSEGTTMAQQAPAISIPQFTEDTSLRARQNVCDRYQRYDEGEVELRQALDGLQLHPVATAGGSSFKLDDAGKIDNVNPGYYVVILDELAKRAGFTWRDSFGMTNRLPPDTNRTYTELLDWGTDYYDFMVGAYDKTLTRLQMGISFQEGIYDSSYILIGAAEPTSDSSINLWQWLEPFQTEVWICIVVTILASGVLYQILDVPTPKQTKRNHKRKPTFNEVRKQQRNNQSNQDNDRRGRRSSFSTVADAADAVYEGAHTIGDGIFLSSLLFTQHFQFVPRTAPARLFSASMGLWALLISSNYTANLASFFVIENTPTIAIQSVEDAIQSGMPICIWGNTASAEFMTAQYPQGIFVEVADDNKEMFSAIRNGACAVGVTSRATFDLYQDQTSANPDCDMIWVGRVIKHVPAGFGVKADSGKLCSSLINDVLNLHLVEMEIDGFLDGAWKDHMAKSHDQNCAAMMSSQTEEASASRSLKEMAGTFLIHLVFAVAAILLMIITRLYDKYKRMSDKSRQDLRLSVMGSMAGRGGVRRQEVVRGNQVPQPPESNLFDMDYEEDQSTSIPHPRFFAVPQEAATGIDQTAHLEDRLAGMEARLKSMENANRQNQLAMERKLDTLVELLQKQHRGMPSTWDL
ncbi:NMDA receptor subtype of glutamate-gated ion channels with high calcium permeability and voltage-dependent sensitivity to magnesium. Mediated by glycine. This protein plays a key role in synaptic plasticity [Seminavis robusta]|uniref:Ionotropic glutamate receptor C-terminal domain-containing protein n=1 Tax=Seminavis robusta TaxID=568900 RepID=A0A9N8F0X6_9STRA|nr:NMDA receptor subtype of glutamate-gated ion channels with high calcium permeability and voltage-dependent sensitivity to magnesium. Mediated by glycine. This protein plays a key role in synaptic plasticity [Seminavis robusta]|eukprot:Sro2273_g321540.1 NMDA receptor subtype of glutamate-gated ion channels with high calcium permeability and voltage-dependent sensitivity to magnesium. Mediated by glycine. This protein plays a key role in synaptic plasticity (654) ;mRNA; r:13725-15686